MPVRAETVGADAVLFHGEAYDSTCLALFDGARALLVEGLGSAADARDLRATLDASGKRVELLVSTHYFSDHLAAWNLFPNAPVLAHENAAATFWTEQFRTEEEIGHYRPPTLLLSGRLEIAWGRFRLDVFENPGHTPGTINVDIPELDLLHVGDTAVGRLDYIQYSAPESLVRALGRAQARGRGRILRSHGSLAGADVLHSARGYLANLKARTLQARRDGRPIAGIGVAECLPAGPAATDFESFFHARNLASIETRGLYGEAA